MIISGGVNIYPQEVELPRRAPRIDDVAVMACRTTRHGRGEGRWCSWRLVSRRRRELERELIATSASNIAHYKAPRSIDFVSELPRLENGKIYKRMLRDRYYWSGRGSPFGEAGCRSRPSA